MCGVASDAPTKASDRADGEVPEVRVVSRRSEPAVVNTYATGEPNIRLTSVALGRLTYKPTSGFTRDRLQLFNGVAREIAYSNTKLG